MAKTTVKLEMPPEVLAQWKSKAAFADELRMAAAVHWFERGAVTEANAAEIAGVDRKTFVAATERDLEGAVIVDIG